MDEVDNTHDWYIQTHSKESGSRWVPQCICTMAVILEHRAKVDVGYIWPPLGLSWGRRPPPPPRPPRPPGPPRPKAPETRPDSFALGFCHCEFIDNMMWNMEHFNHGSAWGRYQRSINSVNFGVKHSSGSSRLIGQFVWARNELFWPLSRGSSEVNRTIDADGYRQIDCQQKTVSMLLLPRHGTGTPACNEGVLTRDLRRASVPFDLGHGN